MTRSNFKKRFIKPILTITLLTMLALVVTGCEEFGGDLGCSPTLEETTKVEGPSLTIITTDDTAILAVNEHLLNLAESSQAKAYLADFYTISDNWTAVAQLLKDETSVWHVTVDMTDITVWTHKPHWQKASWLVFQDSRVMPSARFQANALRIEADLLELSLQSES